MKRKLLVVLAAIVGMMFFVAIILFCVGSFETFPTSKQKEKVRILTALIAAVCFMIEAAIFKALKQ